MSAGGLSYSNIVGYGKVALPSVESWGTNNNILRDPPKSITTRRVDRVGQTSSITEMVDDSGSRICEGISVYARGVNPFVSVSYNNVGNNGGQSLNMTTGGERSARLPYTIIRDGAFRPPVLLQEDLLPLSRMPRNWTSAFSSKGFTDFSRKLRSCGTAQDTKEVKTETLKGFVRPTATFVIEKPIKEPFEVKYVIQNAPKYAVSSGVRGMDVTQRHIQQPTKEIDVNPTHALARTNMSDNRTYRGTMIDMDTDRYIQSTNAHAVATNVSDNRTYRGTMIDMDTDRYIQSTNAHSVAANVSSNRINHTSIDEILDLGYLPVKKDMTTFACQAPVSGPDGSTYIHQTTPLDRNLPEYTAHTNISDYTKYAVPIYENEIELERNIPSGSFATNVGGGGGSGGVMSDNIGSRNAYIQPKVQPMNGFTAPAQIPTMDRMQNVRGEYESDKSRMNKQIVDTMIGRFGSTNPMAAPQQSSSSQQQTQRLQQPHVTDPGNPYAQQSQYAQYANHPRYAIPVGA